MENFVLSCCSTADLSLEHFQNRNIHYICFHYELNGTVYPDDLGQSMPFDVFYEAMTKGAETKTFQVNVAEFEAYFESFLKEGKDILHLCLSSGITGVMSICPLLHVNYEGKLIPVQKVRTKKKVIEAIEKKMEELAENGLAYDGKCYISHSACQADAEAVASLVESRFPNLNGRVLINSIGTTIGSHTGPGTVALFFWGEERKS